MPTLTFSWQDLALLGMTAGVIGTVAWVGSQQRAQQAGVTVDGSGPGSLRGKKKKAAKSKKSSLLPGGLGDTAAASPPSSANELPSVVATSTSSSEAPPTKRSKAKGKAKAASGTATPTVAPPAPVPAPANAGEYKPVGTDKPMRPLAERLQPKQRKIAVDDMVDTEIQPPKTFARVMRIIDDPAALSPASATESEAEDGWEKVSRTSESAQPTKKQRQNARRREAAKANKATEEAERMSRLAAHRRELDRAKVADASAPKPYSVHSATAGPGEWETVGKKKGGPAREVAQAKEKKPARDRDEQSSRQLGDGTLIWE